MLTHAIVENIIVTIILNVIKLAKINLNIMSVWVAIISLNTETASLRIGKTLNELCVFQI